MPTPTSRPEPGERVAVIGGLRTPFVKRASVFAKLSALELGTCVVDELVQRSGVAPSHIDRVVFGQVVPSLSAPNIAREIVLDAGLPRTIDAYSVSRACATGYQSAADIAQAIRAGDIDCGIAGGADSLSDVPVAVSKPLAAALIKMNRATSLADRIRAFKDVKARDLLPEPPALTERTTGLSMGECADLMAQENGISRASQDEFAQRSHALAAKAWADGRYGEEVMPVYMQPAYKQVVSRDNMVRQDSDFDRYAKLRPAFDQTHGTITAGNSAPLSDGASAVLLMREHKANALGIKPLGYIKSYAFCAIDPSKQMLMSPAYAAPKALARAGAELSDMSLIDLHEAFSAQVLSVLQAFESKSFAQRELGRTAALGQVDRNKVNVMGGSIAIGHPFAATGTRQITQVLRELSRRGGGLGLATACAAGGLGAAMVLEVD